MRLDAYQKAVLGALEDFENACFNYSRQIERLSNVVEQAEASRRAAKMAEIQYREGRPTSWCCSMRNVPS